MMNVTIAVSKFEEAHYYNNYSNKTKFESFFPVFKGRFKYHLS